MQSFLANFFGRIWAEAYSKNTQNIISLLEKNPGARVLDVGCGDGQHTVLFQEKVHCKKIIGIDGLEGRVTAAKKRGVEALVCDLEREWPFPSQHFDAVISNQVIEHLRDLDNFIQEIHRILKPGGYCVVSTENLSSWHNIFALILGFQDFSHHLVRKAHVGNPLSPHFGQKTVTWSAKDNSGVDDTAFPHLKIPTYKSLIKIFEIYKLKFEKGLASGYYPFFGYLSLAASRVDPYHSHFISIKTRKPIK